MGGCLTSALTLLLLFFNVHDQGLFISLLILPQSKQLQNFIAEHEVLRLGHGGNQQQLSSKQERLCACVDCTKSPVVLPRIGELHS